MSHKEMSLAWVESRKHERMDGRWQECDNNGQVIGKVYETEQELDDLLWDKAIRLSIADL